MSDKPAPLPRGIRRAAVLALVLGAMVGFGSAQSMAQVLEPIDYDAVAAKQPPPPAVAGAPDMTKVTAAFIKSYGKSLDGMRSSRVAILMLLSIAASLLFVSSIRMLRPAGVPREGVRRLLGGAALACALFRTLDGAQSTAAARRASLAVDKVAADENLAGWLPGMFSVVTLVVWAGATLVMSGSFLALWMYFKSAGVQAQLGELEKGA